MASGLETLCGQAYGAQQYQKLGIQTYRALISLILVCIPISFLWLSMGRLLFLIGQDPQISYEAGKYIVWMIPSLFAYAIAQSMMKFLQSQSLILPMVLSSIASLCFHILLCWLMVFKSGLENVRAALSISISYWLNVLMLGLFMKYSDSCKSTCAPFTKDAFRGIGEFLRIAAPSAVMICLEWWSFELLILLSGLLPNPQIETSMLSICLNTISLLYTIPFGLVLLQGVARGCGWQHVGAYVNLGAFDLFGIPVAILLAFVFHIGGNGLWIGILGGATVQTILLATITSCINWQQQANKARRRLYDERLLPENSLK